MAEQGQARRKVVIDAGAVIQLQRLERFGGELFSTGGVMREVKDPKARALLQTLPEDIKVREPSPQDLAYTKTFAKATGDLGFLSANDVDLIALTVGLHREAGCELRRQPEALTSGDGRDTFDWAPSKTAPLVHRGPPAADGAAPARPPLTAEPAPAGAAELLQASVEAEAPAESAGSAGSAGPEAAKAEAAAEAQGSADAVEKPELKPSAASSSGPESRAQEGAGAARSSAASAEAEVEADAADAGDDSDGSSAGEWVTPDNIHRFGVRVEQAADLKVTCATADYSVQNVLLQMGITPLTFDGYAVTSVKLWGLVCRACFLFTRDTQKIFCPKCGHDTLVRVPIIVDQDGKATIVSSNRPLRRKGTVFSMPKPKGGRGWKPIFAEDELMIGGRDRELRHLRNLQEKERQLKDPFDESNGARSWHQRGCTSTGRPLDFGPQMQAGYGRRLNPNAGNFRGFGRKKR
mmetsp:Transcript_55931/g.121050  ORF Transcript_55931/g.121050 Transcript_55931/m.121050 type:complete len:465 (+) Transcript_55931:70-1464(+)